MELEAILKLLKEQREKIDRAINALEDPEPFMMSRYICEGCGQPKPVAPGMFSERGKLLAPKPRRHFTPAQKEEARARMKKFWAEKRRAEKIPTKKPIPISTPAKRKITAASRKKMREAARLRKSNNVA